MTYIIYIACILGLAAIDQGVKQYFLSLHQYFDIPIINNVLNLTYTENRGAAFGIMENARTFLIIVTFILVFGCLYFLYSRRLHSKLADISLILIISGGIGNLYDRVIRGFVVDFIYLKIINFAVFNIADSYVCIGAGLLCIFVLSRNKKQNKVLK